MTNIVALSEVADVLLGQTFRGGAEAPEGSGDVKLVQIKDLQEGHLTLVDELPHAAISAEKLKIKLLENDLLFPLRGGRIVASLFHPNTPHEIVTTTNQVAIIRPWMPEVSVEYLLWFFNSRFGRKAIEQIRSGSTIINISRTSLASLKIPMPSFEIQEKIVEMYSNWSQQKKTMLNMIENGDNLMEKFCQNLFSKGG